MSRATVESVAGERDLRSWKVLVTGAGTGFGAEIARVFAWRGATVWVGCRSRDKAEACIERVRERHGDEAAARMRFFPYDGEDLAAIRAATSELTAAGVRLDGLFLNAGTFAQKFRLTPEGHEATFAGNFLGHFELLHGLLAGDGLTVGARVVATLSEGATMNPFARANLEMLERPRAELHSVHDSPHTKILLALMLVELARRVRGTERAGIRCAGVMPGATLTNNVNTGGPVLRFFGRHFGPLLFRSIEQGTAPLVWAALAADLPEEASLVGGVGKIGAMPRKCADLEMAARTWEVAERILGLPALG